MADAPAIDCEGTLPVAPVPRLALRPKEAAKALGIGERKLWELTANENSGIPHVRIGRRLVYPVADLQRWLSEKAQKGGAV